MATWPSGSKASTTNLDAGTDKPSLARADIKQNVDNVNDIIDMFNISSPSDGQILKYNTSNTRFELATDDTGAGGGITTVAPGTNIDVTEDSAGGVTVSLEPVVDGIELKDYKETIYQLSYAATITPDVANGNIQEITLTGNVTFGGFANAEDGQTLTLIINQDATGSRTFSEGLSSAEAMLFAGGDSTLTTDPEATDIMSILYAGGLYYASLAKDFV